MTRWCHLSATLALMAGLCMGVGCPQRDRAKQQDRRQAAQAARRTAAPAAASAPSRPAMRRVHVFVSGRVQGVGFRAFTRQNALSLNLTGWVMNLRDGRVEAAIEGPADKVGGLLEKIRTGPPRARVDKVEITEEQFKGEFQTFEITFEGPSPYV